MDARFFSSNFQKVGSRSGKIMMLHCLTVGGDQGGDGQEVKRARELGLVMGYQNGFIRAGLGDAMRGDRWAGETGSG